MEESTIEKLQTQFGHKILMNFSNLQGKIGIFGGSFDPIHRVHIEIARELLASKRIDRLVFIPAAQNPLKSVKPTSNGDRLAMVLLAIQNIENAYVSMVELERGENSYTIDTVNLISSELNEKASLYWIIGSDCLEQLHLWREIEEIFKKISFITVQRDQVRDRAGWEQVITQLSLSPEAKESLKAHFVMRRPNTVSSTHVRNKRAGSDVEAHLPPEIIAYIKEKKLYQ